MTPRDGSNGESKNIAVTVSTVSNTGSFYMDFTWYDLFGGLTQSPSHPVPGILLTTASPLSPRKTGTSPLVIPSVSLWTYSAS